MNYWRLPPMKRSLWFVLALKPDVMSVETISIMALKREPESEAEKKPRDDAHAWLVGTFKNVQPVHATCSHPGSSLMDCSSCSLCYPAK